MFKNVIRNVGFVDTRIFVGLQMHQCFFGHALMRRKAYNNEPSSVNVGHDGEDSFQLTLRRRHGRRGGDREWEKVPGLGIHRERRWSLNLEEGKSETLRRWRH